MRIPPNDAPMMALAAIGNREAMAILRDGLVVEGNRPGAIKAELAAQAEVFARLAAEHGELPDKISLGSVLLLRAAEAYEAGANARGDALQCEAFAVFDDVLASNDVEATAILAHVASMRAEDGDEGAAVNLDRMIGSLTPAKAAPVASRVRSLRAAG